MEIHFVFRESIINIAITVHTKTIIKRARKNNFMRFLVNELISLNPCMLFYKSIKFIKGRLCFFNRIETIIDTRKHVI